MVPSHRRRKYLCVCVPTQWQNLLNRKLSQVAFNFYPEIWCDFFSWMVWNWCMIDFTNRTCAVEISQIVWILRPILLFPNGFIKKSTSMCILLTNELDIHEACVHFRNRSGFCAFLFGVCDCVGALQHKYVSRPPRAWVLLLVYKFGLETI